MNFNDKKYPLIIVQARRGSSRLKDKVLLPLCGKELLIRMVERIESSKFGRNVVIATTTNSNDDVIARLCEREGKIYYRGDEKDLLDRHYRAALFFKAEYVVKIPSDCPLIAGAVIDKVIGYFFDNKNKYDYVSNLHPATYPDGNDVEIMKFDALERSWKEATTDFQREHTTPYIWDNPEIFRTKIFKRNSLSGKFRPARKVA